MMVNHAKAVKASPARLSTKLRRNHLYLARSSNVENLVRATMPLVWLTSITQETAHSIRISSKREEMYKLFLTNQCLTLRWTCAHTRTSLSSMLASHSNSPVSDNSAQGNSGSRPSATTPYSTPNSRRSSTIRSRNRTPMSCCINSTSVESMHPRSGSAVLGNLRDSRETMLPIRVAVLIRIRRSDH